jgi:hypothetical protein
VIEQRQIADGPFAGSLFANLITKLVADVVKIERSEGDDGMRQWPPLTAASATSAAFSENFASVNCNKRSVAPDLKNADDVACDILHTSRVFDAEHARSCGFLTDVCASDDWSALVTQAASDAALLADDSRHALLHQNRDHRLLDQDMAALVRSASHPGLAQWIASYLAALKQP